MIELDRFKILEKIGEGSMGEVFKAHQISMDRIVAIKVLDPELAEDALFADRFMQEARAIGSLNHPNVVQGIDFGRKGQHLYFVMEFINGPSLYNIIKVGPLEEDEVLEVGLQVARALQHGHSQGIIHRDIKPGNIMISTEGVAKVTDYGLAKRSEGGSKTSTAAGRVLGTPYYISPEQARGEEDIDIRSDVYSLGATLYHAATGKPPFPGNNAPDIMSKAVNEPFPDPRSENPELSAAFSKLVMKMTQKERDSRPGEPAKLVQEIERVMRASAAERQRQSMGANLRRTLRRVIVRDAESEPVMSAKIKMAITGVIAAVAVVVILTVLLPGFRKSKTPAVPVPPREIDVAVSREEKTPEVKPGPGRESYVAQQERKAREELAGKAREAYLSAEAFAHGARDIEEAVARLHQVAASYEGPFAEKAMKLAKEIHEKWENEGVKELENRKTSAAEALGLLNYGAAARAYEDFPENLVKTAAGEQAYRLRKGILEQARSHFGRIRSQVDRLASQGKYDEALELYDKALAFGLKEIVTQARARIARLRTKKAAALAALELERNRKAKLLYDGFRPQYVALIDRKDFAAALEYCKTALSDPSKREIHETVRLHLKDVEMVIKVEQAGRKGAQNLKFQQYTFEIEGGRKVQGLVKEVNGDIIDVEIAGMKGAILGVEISRLAGNTYVALALRVLGDTPESHLACGVFLLLARKDGLGAHEQFALAAAGGLDVSRYQAEIATFKTQQKEQEAGRLIDELRNLIKRKKWEKAAETADKLTKKYGDTEAVKTSRGEIEKAYTDAVLKLAAEERSKATTVKKKMAAGLIGTYYNGRNFDDLRAKRIDATVNFDWGDRNPHPDVRRNNFSIRWEGFVAIPKSGRYTFIVNSDDGCRMWLGGQQLFNDWRDRGATDSSKELTLKKDYYPIKIEYYDGGGAASAKLEWSVGGRRQVIPAEYLCHSSK